MIYVVITVALCLIFCWSALLWGYRDKNTKQIEPHVDAVFDPRCLPIVLQHDPPVDRAVIMIHGYPSTPSSFEYAANRAYDRGYDVYVPLLPGFGTNPKDLYNTTFTQWYGYLESYYRDIELKYDHVFVLGTSMGGAMALRIGEEFSDSEEAPDAIATVAAPVFLNDIRLGVVQRWGYYFMRLVALFTPALNPHIHTGGKRENDGEELWIGYGGAFVRGGVSLMYALRGIRANLHKITVPLYSAHDLQDRTIAFQNLAVIQSGVRSQPFFARTTRMEANHNRHVLLMYRSIQEELTNEILSFFDNHTKEKQSR